MNDAETSQRTLTLTLSVAQADSLVSLLDAAQRASGLAVSQQVVDLMAIISAANQTSLAVDMEPEKS